MKLVVGERGRQVFPKATDAVGASDDVEVVEEDVPARGLLLGEDVIANSGFVGRAKLGFVAAPFPLPSLHEHR